MKCLHFWASRFLPSSATESISKFLHSTKPSQIVELRIEVSSEWVQHVQTKTTNHDDDDDGRTIVMINRENIFNFGHTLFCISTTTRFVNFYVSLHHIHQSSTSQNFHSTMLPRLFSHNWPPADSDLRFVAYQNDRQKCPVSDQSMPSTGHCSTRSASFTSSSKSSLQHNSTVRYHKVPWIVSII